MAPIPADGVSEVVFVDTQAMHYALLYLKYAKAEGLWPFAGEQAGAAAALRDTDSLAHYRIGLQDGLSTTAHLKSAERDGNQLMWCPMSRLEWAHNRLRAHGMVRAAKETVEGRWFAPLREGEILSLLTEDDYALAGEAVRDVPERLAEVDIHVTSTRSLRDAAVWDLAEGVLQAVYMTDQDVIIYASALSELARAIVTYDGYFATVVQGLRDPTSRQGMEAEFAAKQSRIQTMLIEHDIIARGEDLTLPAAVRPERIKLGDKQ